MSRRDAKRRGQGAVELDVVVGAVPTAVVVADGDGHIVLANAAAARLAGRPAADLVGEPVDVVTAGRPDVMRTPIDVDGDALVIVAVDETAERTRIEGRVGLLESFVEASGDALFSTDAAGRIVTWSRGAERVFGFLALEILDRPAGTLFPDHLQPELKLLFDAVASGDGVERVETEVRRKGGMPVPISLTMAPLADDRGRVVGSVAVAQDITEKRLTQATLAEVEARLREGEALAHVGRWLWDVGTGAVQWSEELHRIHDVDPLDFAGTIDSFMACIHADDCDRVRAGMERAVTSGRRFEDEYRVLRRDGEVGVVYVRAEPMVGSADVVVGLRGIGQDVTDRSRRDAP
jgi:PAS domain S-box-containing protein